ncbi:Mitochondrial import inner membrane translocase subunit Tim9 B, partial [Zootermopsis nevadensis]
FKDFLQLFNVISESCFLRCVNTFNSRELTEEEAVCVTHCAGKHIKVNKKVMEIYMEVQPQITKKRMEEMATLQESLEKQNKSSETTEQTDIRKS